MDEYCRRLIEVRALADKLIDFQVGSVVSWLTLAKPGRVLTSRVTVDLGSQFIVDRYPEGISPYPIWKAHVIKTRFGFSVPVDEPDGRRYRFSAIQRRYSSGKRPTLVALFLR